MRPLLQSRSTSRPRAGRSAASLLEAAIVLGMLGVAALWLLPTLRSADDAVSVTQAQAWADAAVDAVVAARRDAGTFLEYDDAGDPAANLTLYDRYATVELTLTGPTTAAAVDDGAGHPRVSIRVTPDATSPGLGTVSVAAATSGGDCVLLRRGFGVTFATAPTVRQVDAVHVLDRAPATCTAAAAAAVAAQDVAGDGWTRPIVR